MAQEPQDTQIVLAGQSGSLATANYTLKDLFDLKFYSTTNDGQVIAEPSACMRPSERLRQVEDVRRCFLD